jgi:hypothetical protein
LSNYFFVLLQEYFSAACPSVFAGPKSQRFMMAMLPPPQTKNGRAKLVYKIRIFIESSGFVAPSIAAVTHQTRQKTKMPGDPAITAAALRQA